MGDITYQNKDVISKYFAENLRNKSLEVYGVKLPRIVDTRPTNLPSVEVNELRIDNIFILEDGSVLIIDYESDYSEDDKIKYLNYIIRILKRYMKENLRIHMLVIYTADVKRDMVKPGMDAGCLYFKTEPAFLTELDTVGIMEKLKKKVRNNEPLTDAEQMEFILLPLTVEGRQPKIDLLKDTIDLAKEITDDRENIFVLAGIIAFSDKIIPENMGKQVKEWLKMTRIAKMYEMEKEQAIATALEEADKQNKLALKKANEQNKLALKEANEQNKKDKIEIYYAEMGLSIEKIADKLKISEIEVKKIINENNFGRKSG